MNDSFTEDEVVDAARRLGSPEFTSEEVARELGAKRAQIRDAFKAARQAGYFEHTHSEPDGTRYFRLTVADAGD